MSRLTTASVGKGFRLKVRNPMTATDQQLASALERIRLERRWSYRQLGDEIGLPEPTVRKFIQLAGKRSFLATTVYPVRKYLARKDAAPRAAAS
jgi:hypothetical protein